VEELADAAVYFYRRIEPSAEIKAQHYTQEALAAISTLNLRLKDLKEWSKAEIQQAVKAVAEERKLKMPKIAMPLRVIVTGETQTPSIDATLELIGREETIARIDRELARTQT